MSINNLLVELLVEELPPKSLKKLGDDFSCALSSSLKLQGLASDDAAVTSFASPRRLAVHIRDVAECAADKSVLQKLMPARVGLDANGIATTALLKKLASLGIDSLPKLICAADGKTETLYFENLMKGTTLAEGLRKAIDESLSKLPIARMMTYQLDDGWSSVQFVRPAHGLVALHGTDIVPVAVLGLHAGRTTQGHRFEARAATMKIREADSYEAQMESEGAVIPSFEKRRAEIMRQLTLAEDKEGLKHIGGDALLDEVTALVEHPNVLVGQFDAEFLEVPQECLILTMKANQKYFPLLDSSGRLTNKFLMVSNISPADASLVIGGNERVVRPRLADARFFFDQDRRKTLESRILGLAKVVYHNKLGTQGERVQRVCAIAKNIGQQLGGNLLALQAEQAALLAKADLLTDMVGEFPELQGIMGRYYAQHDGVNDEIAFAIEDHYKPRFSGDELPRNLVGICVALADKLETLIGMFGIGQVPTGDKDPFALRRHALGVIRMLVEKELPLRLLGLIEIASITFNTLDNVQLSFDVEEFIHERMSGLLRDQGYSAKEIDAVLSKQPQYLANVPRLLAAVKAFSELPESLSLSAANKRVNNILQKNSLDLHRGVGGTASAEVDVSLFQHPAEMNLYQALVEIKPKTETAYNNGDFTVALQVLAPLKNPVDLFFDNVMVNAEQREIRANRFGLLCKLHEAMNRVADLSKLAT